MSYEAAHPDATASASLLTESVESKVPSAANPVSGIWLSGHGREKETLRLYSLCSRECQLALSHEPNPEQDAQARERIAPINLLP
ncbi:MAG: hypothetical protein ACLPKW_33265, partial [Acetobacteraceae bacterium]